jgi:hypothetical protein
MIWGCALDDVWQRGRKQIEAFSVDVVKFHSPLLLSGTDQEDLAYSSLHVLAKDPVPCPA